MSKRGPTLPHLSSTSLYAPSFLPSLPYLCPHPILSFSHSLLHPKLVIRFFLLPFISALFLFFYLVFRSSVFASRFPHWTLLFSRSPLGLSFLSSCLPPIPSFSFLHICFIFTSTPFPGLLFLPLFNPVYIPLFPFLSPLFLLLSPILYLYTIFFLPSFLRSFVFLT